MKWNGEIILQQVVYLNFYIISYIWQDTPWNAFKLMVNLSNHNARVEMKFSSAKQLLQKKTLQKKLEVHTSKYCKTLNIYQFHYPYQISIWWNESWNLMSVFLLITLILSEHLTSLETKYLHNVLLYTTQFYVAQECSYICLT